MTRSHVRYAPRVVIGDGIEGNAEKNEFQLYVYMKLQLLPFVSIMEAAGGAGSMIFIIKLMILRSKTALSPSACA
jgi:hypothetical protein